MSCCESCLSFYVLCKACMATDGALCDVNNRRLIHKAPCDLCCLLDRCVQRISSQSTPQPCSDSTHTTISPVQPCWAGIAQSCVLHTPTTSISQLSARRLNALPSCGHHFTRATCTRVCFHPTTRLSHGFPTLSRKVARPRSLFSNARISCLLSCLVRHLPRVTRPLSYLYSVLTCSARLRRLLYARMQACCSSSPQAWVWLTHGPRELQLRV